MYHLSDLIRPDRSLYCLATFTSHVCMSLQNNPYSFPFILTSGGTAATVAIKQLIYLTWKLMITKDSSSGDNKGRGNPGKIELDWSALEQTNSPVTDGNSSTLSSSAHHINPEFCLMLMLEIKLTMGHSLDMTNSYCKFLQYKVCMVRVVVMQTSRQAQSRSVQVLL